MGSSVCCSFGLVLRLWENVDQQSQEVFVEEALPQETPAETSWASGGQESTEDE
jgi:hypothetical protein